MPSRLITQTIAGVLDSGQFLVDRQSIKRRKTDGLNSRFDRMIQTVNVLHNSPATSSRSQPRRRRAASSSSASVASYDVPKTPVDAYSGFDEGRLGQGFSVLKMPGFTGKKHLPSDESSELDVSGNSSRKRVRTEPVPTWLCNTLSTLDSHHPLRILIPSASSNYANGGRNSEGHSNPSTPAPPSYFPTQKHDFEEPVFAFGPPHASPAPVLHSASLVSDEHAYSGLPESLHNFNPDKGILEREPTVRVGGSIPVSLSEDRIPPDPGLGGLPGLLPFSTPGPAALISAVEYAPLASPVFTDLPDSVESASAVAPYGQEEDTMDFVPFSEPGPTTLKRRHSLKSSLSPSVTAIEIPTDLFSSVSHDSAHEGNPSIKSIHPSASVHLSSTINTAHIQTEAHSAGLHSSPPLSLEEFLASSPTAAPSALKPTPSISKPNHGLAMSPASNFLLQNQDSNADVIVPAPYACPVPFSTPGPNRPPRARATPLKVYFDAPAEDPCTSDPMEEDEYALPLDYEYDDGGYDIDKLGFRWDKFDRGGQDLANREQMHSARNMTYATDAYAHLEIPCTPVLPLAETGRSSSSLGFSADGSNEELGDNIATWILPPHSQPLPGTPQQPCGNGFNHAVSLSPHGQPFAPAPGIFISPLRGPEAEVEETVPCPGRDIEKDAGPSTSIIGAQNAELQPQRYLDHGDNLANVILRPSSTDIPVDIDSKSEKKELRANGSSEHDHKRHRNTGEPSRAIGNARKFRHQPEDVEDSLNDSGARGGSAVEDVQEDAGEHSLTESQESNDSIESWSAVETQGA